MNLMRVLEALLFAADGPLTLEQIALALPDTSLESVEASLRELQERYEAEERGFCLAQAAGGWQLLTHPDFYPYVERFLEGKRRARLSRAALETLAVIAYRQPVTRGELEDLRGVDCGGVLHTLIERDLVTVGGRSQAIGRPLLYKTTEKFLEHFGLMSLTDLPRLEEVDVLLSAEELRAQIESELERRLGSQADSTPAEVPHGEAPDDAGMTEAAESLVLAGGDDGGHANNGDNGRASRRNGKSGARDLDRAPVPEGSPGG
jgi:segregation and condensation protein B